MSNIVIGSRFYKYDLEGKLRVIKIVGWASQDITSAIIIKGGPTYKRFKIPVEKLNEDYTLLNPDAYIHFSIVELDNNIQDIIVSMFRLEDIKKNKTVPYCVCRQNIINIHSTYIKAYENDYEIGMTLSEESCPEGFDYKIMTACNSLIKTITIAAYCDDSLETILRCIKSKDTKYINAMLYKLYTDHINSIPEQFRLEASKIPNHRGYCKTIKALLEYHEFMYDFERAFGITKIKDLNLTTMRLSGDSIDGFLLSSEALDIIEKTYKLKLFKPICIRFDKDINLNDIKRDKLLVKDCNDKTYIILYTTQEELLCM